MNINNAGRIALIPMVFVAMTQSIGAASIPYHSVEVSGLDIFYREAGEGAHPYKRDLPNAELHLLETGHFALEEDGDIIANLIRDFFAANSIN